MSMFSHVQSVNASVVAGFPDLVSYHTVNTTLGAISLVVNIILFMIFITTPAFRSRYVLLIQLCIADSINSFANVLTGLNRIHLYSTAFALEVLPVRSSLECAVEPWLMLKIIGDVLIPISTLWMGLERFTAIMFPLFYRFHVDGKRLKFTLIPILSALFVLLTLLVALILSYSDNHITYFYCGRKAAFGERFGSFIYICNISCNLVATTLNAMAFVTAKKMAKEQPRMQRQLSIIRYYLIISILSTLLVSLPNTIALFQLYVKSVSDAISKPAYWMQTINSGIQFFVYLALNRDFRGRARGIFHRSEKVDNSKYDEMNNTPLNNAKKIDL